MNIFFVHPDPKEAAKQLPNAHVIKMILESCQLMCTTLALAGVEAPYKPTHKNHPSRLWVGERPANFKWVLLHTRGLIDEYHARYGDRKVHKCEAVADTCSSLACEVFGVDVLSVDYEELGGLSPIKLAMPDDLKEQSKGCKIVTYQKYMRQHKQGLIEKTISSKKAEAPPWYLLSDGEFDMYEVDIESTECRAVHKGLCR